MKDRLSARGQAVRVKAICCRDVHKARDFTIPVDAIMTSDPRVIVDDPEISVVMEAMGGIEPARTVALAALRSGKHLITANKEMVAAHLPEIEEALAASPGACMGLEATVCGGIPVIRSLQTSFVADTITGVRGVVNGTSNYILCEMLKTGAACTDVIAEAQRLGYAEADPSADVDGFDARNKLAILCRLVFGCTVDPASIPTVGIRSLIGEDFTMAGALGCNIRLVARADIDTTTASAAGCVSLRAQVRPSLVSESDTLAALQGPTNRLDIRSSNNGVTSLEGPGAGRFPSANSMVCDLFHILDGTQPRAFAPTTSSSSSAPAATPALYESRFAMRVRLGGSDDHDEDAAVERAVLAAVAAASAPVAASALSTSPVASIRILRPSATAAVLTHPMTGLAADALAAALRATPGVVEVGVPMPFILKAGKEGGDP